MRRSLPAVAGIAAVLLSGCYHAVIDTGRAPNGVTIDRPWANSFVYGLVPPPVTETAKTCPGGVAKVETQQSFLNGLVAAITWGIYTPMTITVSCTGAKALGPSDTVLKVGEQGATAAIERAADLSRVKALPVFVQF